MLLKIIILCLSHLILASPVREEYDVEDTEQLMYYFNDFKVKYNKSYTSEEEALRFNNFKKKLAIINELNRDSPMTVYGINMFTDWSAEEMQNLFGFSGVNLGYEGSCSVGVASDIKTGSVSNAIDWREKNAVAPVQDQGSCGSCWAFSAASVLEGAYALKHNTLLKVSEQQFVDCDTMSGGCDGGSPDRAITSTMELGGQELENDYPYKDKQQKCQFDENKAKVKVSSCKFFLNMGDSDDKLASLLASAGPLSIAMDADTNEFHSYKGGIIMKCVGAVLNHAVTLIGYGEENGTPYWIIKNSWGTHWGENGFVRIKRGENCLMIDVHQERTENVLPTEPKLVEQSQKCFEEDVPQERRENEVPTDPKLVKPSQKSFIMHDMFIMQNLAHDYVKKRRKINKK